MFGYKINLTTGASSLIIECPIFDGNPSDTQAYGGVIDRIKEHYGVVQSDMATDRSFVSPEDQRVAKDRGSINIVFNKIFISLKNLASSMNTETWLKKWRNGIEAVISNLKRNLVIFGAKGYNVQNHNNTLIP